MVQGHHQSPGRPRVHSTQELHKSLVRHRHPVLTPVALLGGALALCIASAFTGTVFPLLVLLRIPASQLCLAIALALGISGILTGIVGIIERLDQHYVRAELALPKEHSYADCN